MVWLSNAYTAIARGNPEDLGNCTACDYCDIYYKTAEREEECKKGKWKSIYISNKK